MPGKKEPVRNPRVQGVLEDMFKKNFQKTLSVIQAESLRILTNKKKKNG